MPCDEGQKQKTSFKAKISINECITNIKMWVSQEKGNATKNVDVVDDINATKNQ